MAAPVHPRVYLIAKPCLVNAEVHKFLLDIDAPEWDSNLNSSAERVIEMMGRLCYKSWKPGMNPNVTKVREDSFDYLQNIIRSGHGSVLEHAQVSFIFTGVSRVFTHELVRHRAGTAISQESLRYVRLDKLEYPESDILASNPEGMAIVRETMDYLEIQQGRLHATYGIEELKKFSDKKKLTSAFRRIAPIGLATNIGWSANFRTLRHVLEMRTSRHAEEEIRKVFSFVGSLCKMHFPAVFGDYEVEEVDGYLEFTTENRKV